jgi:antitoxin YefM
MLAVNYTTMRNKLKDYCDLVSNDGETIIVTRKADRNVVVLSLDRYNAMEKELRNAKFLEKIDRAFDQLYAGKGKVHELVEIGD